VAVLHVSHRQAIGSPWVYPWEYPWIYPWISTKKSVDMDVDMDEKFHIHGKPVKYSVVYFDPALAGRQADTHRHPAGFKQK